MRVNTQLYQQAEASALLQRFFRESFSSGYMWRLLGIPLTIIVALLDYYTGNELNLSVLYLLPIALASWKLAKEEAIVVAAFSALVWFVEDYLIQRHATSLWVPLLNMLALFGYFLTMVLVLSALRKAFAAQQRLIEELQDALGQVKTLSGLLPICSWCKKVRDDHGYWTAVESYIQKYSLADVTHGICPDCLATHFTRGRGHEDRAK